MENKIEGNPLVVELEIKGEIVKIEIICPNCRHKLYWLTSNYRILACEKCGCVMGIRHGDQTAEVQVDLMDMGVKWKI